MRNLCILTHQIYNYYIAGWPKKNHAARVIFCRAFAKSDFSFPHADLIKITLLSEKTLILQNKPRFNAGTTLFVQDEQKAYCIYLEQAI